MTEKRFKVHSMIQGMEIRETMDLELCEELIKKYGSSSDIDLLIEDNGKNMTYQEVVDLLNDLSDENEKLKSTIIQLSIDFMDFKRRLLEQLRMHYDYAREQRQKNIGNHFLVKEYDSMCYEVRELAGEMSLDLNVMRFIKANKEIDELKRINKKLNKVCFGYSFEMEKLEKENEELKKRNEYLKKRCNEYWEEAGLNSDYFE